MTTPTEPTIPVVTIVATLSLPLPLDSMEPLNVALEAAYGPGLRVRQTGTVLEVIRP